MRLGYLAWARYPDFGIPAGITLTDLLKGTAAMGYDTFEIAAWRSTEALPTYMNKNKREEVRKLLDDLGLKCVCIDAAGGCPHYSSEYGYIVEDTIERAGIIHFLKKCIDLACDLGADKVLDLSGRKPGEMSEKRAWELLSTSVADICDYASDRGVSYLMEMEYHGYMVHDAESALRLSKEVDSKAFKMNFDYSNLLLDGLSDVQAQKAVKTISKLIVNGHLKGLKSVSAGKYVLTVPGSKDDVQDLRGFFSALKQTGYEGSINVEDVPEYQQPPINKVESARLSYNNISKIMKEVGVRKS